MEGLSSARAGGRVGGVAVPTPGRANIESAGRRTLGDMTTIRASDATDAAATLRAVVDTVDAGDVAATPAERAYLCGAEAALLAIARQNRILRAIPGFLHSAPLR